MAGIKTVPEEAPEGDGSASKKPNRYVQIIDTIFHEHYTDGAETVEFTRDEIRPTAERLGIDLPKNLGDITYSFRYRTILPDSITSKAPEGKVWVIRPTGKGLYQFALVRDSPIVPNPRMAETKIADSTPGVVLMYSGTDEQALLAKLRYNRLIDIFMGVTCYSLQNHLRTTVPGMGQIETDEIYIGVDKRGAHYVFPIQAKGGSDKANVVQIEQDIALCRHKFSGLICQAIGAQFMADDIIALFAFEESEQGVAVVEEKHYRLVSPDDLTADELATYRNRPTGG